MGILDVFRKKKIEPIAEEKEGVDKPLESLHPPQHPEELSQQPFGKGITEPEDSSDFGHRLPAHQERSFDMMNMHEERRVQPVQFQQNTDADKLILAKLETIKAQLDFLQQKFEKIEQQLNKEDTVRWR